MSFLILYTGVIITLLLFLRISHMHLPLCIWHTFFHYSQAATVIMSTLISWQITSGKKNEKRCTSPNSWQSYLWWEGHGRLTHSDRGVLIWGGTSHHHTGAREAEDDFINMESRTHYSTNWCCVATSLPSLGCLVSGMPPSKEVLKSKQRLAGRETNAFTSHLAHSSCGKSEWRRSPMGLLTNRWILLGPHPSSTRQINGKHCWQLFTMLLKRGNYIKRVALLTDIALSYKKAHKTKRRKAIWRCSEQQAVFLMPNSVPHKSLLPVHRALWWHFTK